MPTPTMTMRKIKDVLRLKLQAQLSHEQIAAALRISKGAVTKYANLAACRVEHTTQSNLERRSVDRPARPGNDPARNINPCINVDRSL